MSTLMRERVLVVGLGALALIGGMLVGPSGCTTCDCPELDPFSNGMLEITASERRPELVGGLIAVDDDGVEVSYSLDDGSDWVIRYAIDERVPEDK